MGSEMCIRDWGRMESNGGPGGALGACGPRASRTKDWRVTVLMPAIGPGADRRVEARRARRAASATPKRPRETRARAKPAGRTRREICGLRPTAARGAPPRRRAPSGATQTRRARRSSRPNSLAPASGPDGKTSFETRAATSTAALRTSAAGIGVAPGSACASARAARGAAAATAATILTPGRAPPASAPETDARDPRAARWSGPPSTRRRASGAVAPRTARRRRPRTPMDRPCFKNAPQRVPVHCEPAGSPGIRKLIICPRRPRAHSAKIRSDRPQKKIDRRRSKPLRYS